MMLTTALFALTFCGGSVLTAMKLGSGPSSPDCDAPANICQLRTELLQRGLRIGYATYWNANVTTLTSQGKVTVCGVTLVPRITPFRWLVSKDCFDPPKDDRYFIAMTRAEAAQIDRDALIAETGPPDEVARGAAYEIWIYRTEQSRLSWLSR
jgi:hypothetical protein